MYFKNKQVFRFKESQNPHFNIFSPVFMVMPKRVSFFFFVFFFFPPSLCFYGRLNMLQVEHGCSYDHCGFFPPCRAFDYLFFYKSMIVVGFDSYIHLYSLTGYFVPITFLRTLQYFLQRFFVHFCSRVARCWL